MSRDGPGHVRLGGVGWGATGWLGLGRVRDLVMWGQDRSDRSGQVGSGGVRMIWVRWFWFGGVGSGPSAWVRFSPVRWVSLGWVGLGPTGLICLVRSRCFTWVGSHPTGWVVSDGSDGLGQVGSEGQVRSGLAGEVGSAAMGWVGLGQTGWFGSAWVRSDCFWVGSDWLG